MLSMLSATPWAKSYPLLRPWICDTTLAQSHCTLEKCRQTLDRSYLQASTLRSPSSVKMTTALGSSWQLPWAYPSHLSLLRPEF